jgi:hypothetical protein
MDNTVADLEAKLALMMSERDEAWRRAAHSEKMWGEAEVKMAECEARLRKAVEALREWDDLIKHQYSGSREAMSDMTYAAQHTAALLAEIEGEQP